MAVVNLQKGHKCKTRMVTLETGNNNCRTCSRSHIADWQGDRSEFCNSVERPLDGGGLYHLCASSRQGRVRPASYFDAGVSGIERFDRYSRILLLLVRHWCSSVVLLCCCCCCCRSSPVGKKEDIICISRTQFQGLQADDQAASSILSRPAAVV